MDKVKLIAISGFKGSGKDTVAEMAAKLIPYYHKKTMVKVWAMADPIRAGLKATFGLRAPEYGDKETERTNPRLPVYKQKSYRDMMIRFGSVLRKKFGDEVFAQLANDALHKAIREARKKRKKLVFIISDIRFTVEQRQLLHWEYELGSDNIDYWCVIRNSVLPEWVGKGFDLRNPLDVDFIKKEYQPSPSEFEWCLATPYFTQYITNNGSLNELKNNIEQIVKNL